MSCRLVVHGGLVPRLADRVHLEVLAEVGARLAGQGGRMRPAVLALAHFGEARGAEDLGERDGNGGAFEGCVDAAPGEAVSTFGVSPRQVVQETYLSRVWPRTAARRRPCERGLSG